MSGYFLTKDTFICESEGAFVFLSLRTDSYICLEPEHTSRMRLLLGLRDTYADEAEPEADDSIEFSVALQGLLDARLVTDNPASGKQAELIEAPDMRELPRLGVGVTPAITVKHVTAFLIALATAKALLAFTPIERIVARVAKRKARSRTKEYFGSISELIEAFIVLRAIFISKRNRCLLNSLILLEFLSRFGLHPSWNFGVHLKEFAAHCWVQKDNVIYDDDVERVSRYSIIMTV